MDSKLKPEERIILALDGMDYQETFALISRIPDLSWVKVGLELFISEGPQIIFDLRKEGLNVFLDLKFHDIPKTISGACRQAAKTGAELITVHACSGINALEEAKAASIEGALESGFDPPTLLAVTVLTSWKEKQLIQQLSIRQSLLERVRFFAKMAFYAGFGGVVCSPYELKAIRNILPDTFQLITPGIRLKGNSLDDQVRVMTPSDALKLGANRLVIGRSISSANNPNEVFKLILSQLS